MRHDPPRHRIGLDLGRDHAYTRQVRRGVAAAIRDRSLPWILVEVGRDPGPLAGVVGLLRHPASLQRALAAGCPVVNVSGACAPRHRRVWTVAPDHRAIGVLAADHLLDRGYRLGVAIGQEAGPVQGPRYAAFRDRLLARGAAYRCIDPWAGLVVGPDLEERCRERLAGELVALGQPAGVWCFTDFYLPLVRDACACAGLAVPQSIGILGTDDDALTCELGWPILSSIDVGAYSLGIGAASILQAVLSGEASGPRLRTVLPRGVSVRCSTDHLAIADADLRRVLVWIRDHPGQIRTIEDVVRQFPLTRRSLERRMRQSLGHGVLAAVIAARLEAARRLLGEGLAIEQVARQVGFGSRQGFAAAFKRWSGASPSAWRADRREQRDPAQRRLPDPAP